MTSSAAEPGRTLLARLTPPGTGAIAALALHGPDAWNLLEALFQPLGKSGAKNPFRAEARAVHAPGKFWLGKLGEPGQDLGDEVVIALKQMVPQPWLEIHCHGGQQVVAMLEELFAARGVQVCPWPEWLRATGSEPLEITAIEALGAATTTRTAAILLDQLHGAFAKAVQNILNALQTDQKEQAAQQLRELARWVPLGQHLTLPWRVAVAGAPNVGKSSLMNRLAGYQRCVVAPTPGTTRDLVTVRLAVDGWPVELIDTAGIRDQAGTLEAQGIELALAAATEADVCLWLLDASAPPILPPRSLLSLRLVINKMDLPAAWDLAQCPDAIRIAATNGTGVDDLLQALSRWLVPEVPPEGTALPFTPELCAAVESADQCAQRGAWQEAVRVLYNLWQGKDQTTPRS